MPPPNFSVPPPGFQPPSSQSSGNPPIPGLTDGQELWVETKAADGKVSSCVYVWEGGGTVFQFQLLEFD